MIDTAAKTAGWDVAYRSKLIDPTGIEEQIGLIKSQGLKIVTLNGSFDLMHAGHLHFLYEAKQQGDVLIAALNTDRSIKEYKGLDRPIIALEYRLQMMAALEFVDYVTWFDEPDPRSLLSRIQPAVHVNGATYGKDCVEAEIVQASGGKLHLVDIVPGLSTSRLIQKIKGG